MRNNSVKSESSEDAQKLSNDVKAEPEECKEPALARFATRVIPERPFSLDVADDTAAAKLAVPEHVDLALHYEGAYGALAGTYMQTHAHKHMH
jgi:hypothetical protein